MTRYERNRWKFEHVIRNMWGKNYGRFTTVNITKYEYFTRKINITYSHPQCVSVIVSSDFCCFKLALPSLLFLSKDEVKAAHSDFDRKSSRSASFSTIFYDLRSLHPGTCLNTKTPRAFRWKRSFSTWISKFASFWLCFEQANWTRPRMYIDRPHHSR